MSIRQMKPRQERKELAVHYKGGKCQDCGFEGPDCCFHFDHRDPNTKTYSVGQLMQRARSKKLLEELDKCDLVCANCHSLRTQDQRIAINKKISMSLKKVWKGKPKDSRSFSPTHRGRIAASVSRAWSDKNSEERLAWTTAMGVGLRKAWKSRLG